MLSDQDIRRFALQDDPMNAKGPRGQLVEYIKASAFTIEWIEDPQRIGPDQLRRGDSFGFFLKPKREAKLLYGIDREILLWCSTFPTFSAKDINTIQAVIEASGARLSRQFAILVSGYDADTRSQIEGEAQHDLTLVHVSLKDIRDRGLRILLADKLFSRDLFDVSGATVKSADFFGRRELVDRLVGEVEGGTSQTGVFGLRKVGKTSLLNRLADRLQNSGKCNVARLDLQWTVAINTSAEYTLWALGASIFISHRSVRTVKGFRLFGQYDTYSDVPNPELIWEWFAHDTQLLLEQTKRRVCIIIDEIERMFERPRERSFVRFWRVLRGLDQQFPGRLRYLIGGTSPSCAELDSIDSEDNPLFRYLRIEYLSSLADRDARELLQTLGNPMGLSFDSNALDWVMDQCAGHPALLRTIGTTVHLYYAARAERTAVRLNDLVSMTSEVAARSASVIDHMLSALEDQYSDEFYLLQTLAKGQLYEFREMARVFPADVKHLEDYGLISGGPTPGIRLQLLHARLVTRSEVDRGAGPSWLVLQQGASIGPWEVLECLASGSYGDVYLVQALGIRAAAKVIRGGQLSALEREVDILQSLNHENIVKFKDSIRADDGSPCLIMEYLEGESLSALCNPATAPGTKELMNWLASLLGALAYMHPKSSVIRSLEQKESLTSAEFAEWDLAKYGYVHRDIKPENIVLTKDRGPVLVDFNISVRAGAPVLTVSATPGYLPQQPAQWDPYVDIHALGITFIELAAGLRLAACSIPELLEVAGRRHPAGALNAIAKLLDSPSSGIGAEEARQLILRAPR